MTETVYVGLPDFLIIAAAVTGLDDETIVKVTNLTLADSALNAPAAGFGDEDFYPDFIDKAAVLVVRLARNHPLPDGNKRAAWVTMNMFLVLNGWVWERELTIDEAEAFVVAVAAGEVDEDEAAMVLRPRLRAMQGESRHFFASFRGLLPPDDQT